jgi:hypothetical protein
MTYRLRYPVREVLSVRRKGRHCDRSCSVFGKKINLIKLKASKSIAREGNLHQRTAYHLVRRPDHRRSWGGFCQEKDRELGCDERLGVDFQIATYQIGVRGHDCRTRTSGLLSDSEPRTGANPVRFFRSLFGILSKSSAYLGIVRVRSDSLLEPLSIRQLVEELAREALLLEYPLLRLGRILFELDIGIRSLHFSLLRTLIDLNLVRAAGCRVTVCHPRDSTHRAYSNRDLNICGAEYGRPSCVALYPCA